MGEGKSKIYFNDGAILIKGCSVAMYTNEMYKPLIVKFTNYAVEPSSVTQIDIQLDKITNQTSRALLNLFAIAEKIHKRGHSVKVNWHYIDIDKEMYQQGKILESLVDIPFEFYTLAKKVDVSK